MYQKEYAATRPQMYDESSRKLKASNIIKILSHYYGAKKLKTVNVLDVGASSGIIDSFISDYVKSLVGIDIDKGAISHAKQIFKKKNLLFKNDDALNLSFTNNSRKPLDFLIDTSFNNSKKLFFLFLLFKCRISSNSKLS